MRRMALWAAVVGACAAWAAGQGGPPPARVSVDPARLERVEAKREVTGEIRAVRRASLASREGGIVVEVAVDEGQWVEAEAVLARLDDRLRRLDVDRETAARRSAEALVEERRAQVAKAQRDLDRLRTLQQGAGASQNEVDDAATRLAEESARLAHAQAEVESAKAEEATARRRLEDMVITAPFAGSVVRKEIEVGEWVSEGDAVAEMVGVDAVDAMLDVPERFVPALASQGATVSLRIPALGRVIEAPVSAVMAAGDRLARTFAARVRIDNTPGGLGAGLLRSGMSVIGLVSTGEPVEAITIHKDAVMRNDAGAFVYIDAGGTAGVAPIEPLYAVGDRVVVRSPLLKAGTGVITQGNERVFPGQPLMILGADGVPVAPAEAAGPTGGASSSGKGG